MIGVLPCGARPDAPDQRLATFFWSLKGDDHPAWRSAGLAPWKAEKEGEQPDAVFVDVSLPDARGREHLETLMARARSAGRAFEVIALVRDTLEETWVHDVGIASLLIFAALYKLGAPAVRKSMAALGVAEGGGGFLGAEGAADGAFEAVAPDGETLFHLFSIPGHACQPVIPVTATVVARRVPIPVFGAGLVEAIEAVAMG